MSGMKLRGSVVSADYLSADIVGEAGREVITNCSTKLTWDAGALSNSKLHQKNGVPS
jgi:hypothetical protein